MIKPAQPLIQSCASLQRESLEEINPQSLHSKQKGMFRTFSRTLLSSHRLFNFTPNPKTPFHLILSSMSTAAVKRVGTHNGSFHCDEALGCFMIRRTKKFSDAHIVRTRDPQVILSALMMKFVNFSCFCVGVCICRRGV